MKKLVQIFIYGISAIALVLALYTDNMANNAMKLDVLNRSGTPPSVTQKAPDFTVRKINESTIITSDRLYSQSNSIVIISSPSCPFTQQLAEALIQELEQANKDTDSVNLILDGGNTPLTKAEEKTWAEKYPRFNVYADYNSSTAWGFKVQAYPTQYVLDKNQTILYRQSGYAGPKAIKLLIQKFAP